MRILPFAHGISKSRNFGFRLGFALPVLLAIAAGSSGAEAGYQQGRAGWGGRIVPVPLWVQAQDDLLPGEGGLVVRVRPESTADWLGVQPGDVVLNINQNPIANRHDIRDVLSTVAPGDQAQVTLAGDDGQQHDVGGKFLPRLPRPNPGDWRNWPGLDQWAGGAGMGAIPPGSWRNSDETIQQQREELVAEREQLQAAKAEIAAARAGLPAEDGSAWFLRVDIACAAADSRDAESAQ